MKFYSVLLGPLALVSLPGAASETNHHWSYSGQTGPGHWSTLESDYATCGTGKAQSPINIERARVRQHELPPLIFNYKPAALHIVDNGHTIQIDVPTGSELTVGGDKYALIQFHFHRPSEERIEGKPSEMVVHLVHRDSQGHLAVVAVLMQSGRPNTLLSTLWQNLPHAKGQQSSPRLMINAAALLPEGRGYYTYPGSLTTPPCSQGVRWFVLKSPMTLSANQLETFTKIYSGNARPPQPLNGRVVVSSK